MTEQISLFEELYKSEQQYFADRICEEFNKLDTVFKGKFYVEKVSLELWEHVPMKNKVLSISIKAEGVSSQNSFMQFAGDKKSQENIDNIAYFSPFVAGLCKDKDFALCITPWVIYIYYHNFELKRIKL